MRILVVTDSHFKEYGGPFTAISQKIKYLNEKNIKNKLIYKSSNNYNYNLDLKPIIEDYDIVHIYGIWRPFLAKVFLIAKLLKKKIVISPLGAMEPWALNQKKLKKLIAWKLYQKKILNSADVVHATCNEEAENLINNSITSKIEIIAHGIEDSQKVLKKETSNKIKKIIFFSRIHLKKGILELIDCWKDLDTQITWQLDIYGPISDKKYYELMLKKIRVNNLENNIFYKGSVFNKQDKDQIFKNANAFILPSKSENFGISIGEALSYGLPVLTTTETPWELINEYQAGYVFPFSRENIMTYLNKLFLLNDEELYQMGLNSQKLINENYKLNTIFEQYVELYKRLVL